LFADILIDKAIFGQVFLNILQIKSQSLLRHFVAALILNRNIDDLNDIVLPIILQEKDNYSDSFTAFVEALYENFDFEKAAKFVNSLAKEAEDDLLLKPFASEIQL